ncbi:MAG: glutamine synthetase family protein [Gammaproteobacteria bacterium]
MQAGDDGDAGAQALAQRLRTSGARFVTAAVADMNGLLRAKLLATPEFLHALESGRPVPRNLWFHDGDDRILECPGLSDGSDGYGDARARILPDTARTIPWAAQDANLLVLMELDGADAALCPRALYRRVADRAAAAGCTPVHGIELEFTVFGASAAAIHAGGYRALVPAGLHSSYESLRAQAERAPLYADLRTMCEALRIPLVCMHEEMGPGFMEAAIAHEAGPGVADAAVLFKTWAHVAAARHGASVTFMARWSNEVQGQGGHVNLSLRGTDGANLFHDPAAPAGLSTRLRHFLGGLQRFLPEFIALCCPTVNSFKRLQPEVFAPTAATWGLDNRTCAFRVVTGASDRQRIECRVPGADASPYLSLAAAIAAGMCGIQARIEPAAPIAGNAYRQPIAPELAWPRDLRAAAARLLASQAARDWFGARFVEAFAHGRIALADQFDTLVTDVERRRYFDLA